MKKILLISGSLRTASRNTAWLRAVDAALTDSAEVMWADLNLPLFNEELEADFPASATMLREQVTAADAVVIATPEYNRAMTGALKNAIDWASRPYGKNAWAGKCVMVASVSPGGIAGALASYQVKQSLLHLGAKVSPKEMMVGHAGDKFNEAGELSDEKTKEYIAQMVEALLA